MKKIYTNNLKISVAQMSPTPMNVVANLSAIKDYINKAKNTGSQVVVFPELCVSGYVLGDRFEYSDFINELQEANDTIREMSEGIVVVWGNIVSDTTKIGEDGRIRKYNAVLIAYNGKWVSNGVLLGFLPKNNLPKYRIFDDSRHFYPAYKLVKEMNLELNDFFKAFEINIDGVIYKIALAICEDMWEDEYSIKLSKIYQKQNIDLLVDVSASPWTLGKWHARENMLVKRVKDLNAPMLYVNCVGLQNNGKNLIWFDGASVFVKEDGEFVFRAENNINNLYSFSVADLKANNSYKQKSEVEELYSNITSAMYEFYKDFNKVVVGLSGGIDSALTLALLCAVLPKEKILTVNMPTRFNSSTTKDLAKKCAENFGVEYKVVAIDELFEAQCKVLLDSGLSSLNTLVKENIQARLRLQQLATISASYGGVFTNNGNKTEVSLNYFTLYGDAGGSSAFLGDLWKGQVYELSKYINLINNKELIPEGIINIIPSAELSENQNVDEGKGDPIFYEYHDKLLLAFVESRIGITDILVKYEAGTLEKYLKCEEGTIAKYFKTTAEFINNLEWAWNAYNTEYKRVQLPPVFLASRRAFGFDRRDTIAPAFFSQEYVTLKEKLLTSSDTAT